MQNKEKFEAIFNAEMAKVNLEQKEAIDTIEGPVLVLAGPGTGKTQILALRIGNILQQGQVSANEILCLTYTDAGAIAMRKRLSSFIGTEALKINIHTFHSFCNKIIQENKSLFSENANLEPVTDLETLEIYYEIIDELPKGHILKNIYSIDNNAIKPLKNLFDTIKKESFEPSELVEIAKKHIKDLPTNEEYLYKANRNGSKKGDPKQKDIDEETERMTKFIAAIELFETFIQKMKKAKRYDFNDMIQSVINVFKNNENLLARYQEQFQYVLVDEYQDSNGSQNEILDLLSSYWQDQPNLFVVGDDDQSIFSFQGAENKRINDFVAKYSQHLKAIVLTKNYRSTQQILDIAQSSVNHNKQRLIHDENLKLIFKNKKLVLHKNLEAQKSTAHQQVNFREYFNAYHEAAHIVFEIEELYKNNENLSEIAIIYYQHKHVEHIMKAFDVKKIPYNVNKKLDIFKLPLINKILDILNYLAKESDSAHVGESLLVKILHYDFFDFTVNDISRISAEAISHKPKTNWRNIISNKNLMFWLGISSVEQFYKISENINQSLKSIHNKTLQLFFEEVINLFEIRNYVLESENKLNDLQALTTFFDFLKSETQRNPSLTLQEWLVTIKKMKDNDLGIEIEQFIGQKNGVNFITTHSCKGLEYNTVYIINVESKSWEDKRNKNESLKFPPLQVGLKISKEAEKEETRRLFYVALTRAKQYLYISYPAMKTTDKSLDKASLECSQFITEIIQNSDHKIEKISLDDSKILDFLAINFMPSPKIEIAKLEESYINNRLENYKLNVTHLNKYLKCPITFYYEYILKYPMAGNPRLGVGNALHEALERFFKQMLESPNREFPNKQQLLYYFKNSLLKFEYCFTKDEYTLNKDKTETLLEEYFDFYIEKWHKDVVLEHRFSNIEIDGVPITGVLDKIEKTGNEVNVVDYKTGNIKSALIKLKAPEYDTEKQDGSFESEFGGDYWRQIVFYKILMDNDKTHNWKMLSGEIDFFTKHNKKEFTKKKYFVKDEDVAFVKKQIKTTYQNIKDHKFSVGCGDEDCFWCNLLKDNKKNLN